MFRPPKPVSMTLNLAPMVDVMMCLIVFFLLAAKLVNAQRRPVNLPYALAASEVDRGDLGARIVINVAPSSESPGAAEYLVGDWDGRNIVERKLAPGDIPTVLAGRAARAAEDKESVRCVIRADERVQYRDIEVILRGCGLAKIRDVVFSANSGIEPSGGGG